MAEPLRRAPRFSRMTASERRAALVAAGLACMARGGIQEFTVDRICAEAGVSRGLITHHFGSMNGLLAAVYAAMYESSTPADARDLPPGQWLSALLSSLFDPAVFHRDTLTIWLTLWGQMPVNDALRAEHRRRYADYLAAVSDAIAATATANGRKVDATPLARALICLIDGLGIQHCIDPASMPPEAALRTCRDMLLPHLGRF